VTPFLRGRNCPFTNVPVEMSNDNECLVYDKCVKCRWFKFTYDYARAQSHGFTRQELDDLEAPPPPKHEGPCGPEAGCDSDCANWAAFCAAVAWDGSRKM
jgi:hypothetical protein